MRKITKTAKIFILALIFAALCREANAQQDPMFTQYMSNVQMINAGYAGTGGCLSAMMMSRNQWVGFDGAPQTNVLLINSPLPLFHNFGVGLSLINDRIGPINNTSVYLDFSFNFKLTKKIRLAMGAKGGFNVFKPDHNGLDLVDPNDPVFTSDISSSFMPNFGFGLYMYTPKYYLGVSTPTLISSDLESGDGLVSLGKQSRHFFVVGGYLFNINKNLRFKPSGMLKVVENAPLSFDITAAFILWDKLWLGGMYRFGDSFGALIQYQITKQFRIGYSYDMAITEMQGYNSGTHEFMLSYDFSFTHDKIKTPRFF